VLVVVLAGAVAMGLAVDAVENEQATNPWTTERITVTINNSTEAHDFEPLARNAIGYWNARMDDLGYTGRFVYSTEPEGQPDVEIRVVSEVEGEAVGRAPVNDGVGRAAGTSVIRIQWDGAGSTQQILTHEFGHTLGLTHADHPQWGVMQTLNRSAIDWNYSNPWERRELAVYSSHSSATNGFTAEQMDAITTAIEFYNDGGNGYLNHSLRLRPTRNRSRADIEVRKIDQLPDTYGCDHDYSSYRSVDGELRYETFGIIRIDQGGNDSFYRDCVGDGLSAFLIEADGGRPPPRFDDPTALRQ
jgi:hypothetical protein